MMRPAELSILFGQLAIESERSPAEGADMKAALRRAASCTGSRKLRELVERAPGAGDDALCSLVKGNQEAFGEPEARVLSGALAGKPIQEVARAASEHYRRMDEIESSARTGAFVPALCFLAFMAIAALLCTWMLPRFGDALAALGIGRPFITRVVLHGALLFQVVVWPVFLSAVLLVLVLVLYWRRPEGRARLSRWLPRTPWLGPLHALASAARFATRAALAQQLEVPFGDPPPPDPAGVALDVTHAAFHAQLDHADQTLPEHVLLTQRLAMHSRRAAAVAQIALLILTLTLCAIVVLACWIPVMRLHDSMM